MFKRVLIIGCLILAARVLALGIDKEPGRAKLLHVGSESLPENIGDFVGQDKAVNTDLRTATGSDVLLNRSFRNKVGDTVDVSIGVWTQYEMGIPHCPEECYPSAGWETVSRDVKIIGAGGSNPVAINQLVFQRENNRVAVVYWAHLGPDVIREHEQVRRMRQSLRRTHESLPPLVKVMLQTDARDVGQAEARLSRFVSALMPYTAAIH